MKTVTTTWLGNVKHFFVGFFFIVGMPIWIPLVIVCGVFWALVALGEHLLRANESSIPIGGDNGFW